MTTETPPFNVERMFHPTLHVADLDYAADFYARVFGRGSRNISEVMQATPDHAADYSIFTIVGDVLLDTLSPKKYRTNGEQRYPDIEIGDLKTTGWYVTNVSALYERLRDNGIRVTNSRDIVLEVDTAPKGAQPFHGHPEDTGIRYHFFEEFSFPLDPRTAQNAGPELLTKTDPLGILATSHHTVLSDRPERTVFFLTEILGGTNLGPGRDELQQVTGTLVRVAESIFLVGVADHESPAHESQPAPGSPTDCYYSVTWQVSDLPTAAAHLTKNGVVAQHHTATGFVCAPETSLGVPWAFTTLTLNDLQTTP